MPHHVCFCPENHALYQNFFLVLRYKRPECIGIFQRIAQAVIRPVVNQRTVFLELLNLLGHRFLFLV